MMESFLFVSSQTQFVSTKQFLLILSISYKRSIFFVNINTGSNLSLTLIKVALRERVTLAKLRFPLPEWKKEEKVSPFFLSVSPLTN